MNYNKYLLELTKKMITFKSVNPPGNEKELAEYLKKELESIGMTTYLEIIDESRANVIGRFGLKDSGKKIVLNGHLDVVPPGSGWENDPFIPTVKDGKLYGRGSADMKGGIASMIVASKMLIDEGYDMNGELILAFVCDEELHNLGTRTFLRNNVDVDYAIIGEPTDLNINLGHKGTARYNINIIGKPCHSSAPELGINSIYKMAKLLMEIEKYNERLNQKEHKYLFSPTVAVTVIKGGEKDNIIPDNCEIQIDRRMIPGESIQEVELEIYEILDKLKAQDEQFEYSIKRYIYLEPAEISDTSILIEACKDVYNRTFNESAILKGFMASCEQQLFLEKGIETVIFGPGSLKQAHIIDEYIETEQLYMASKFYANMVKEILK